MEIVNCPIYLPKPHPEQEKVRISTAKRKILRAGRRWGKTVVAGICAVDGFANGRRILYAAPTTDQVNRFWVTVTRALREGIDKKYVYKNETERIIEMIGTETRIKAKSAWNADSLRGDYADELILDEFQLMNEDIWNVVGAPMLLDNDGDALFIYTPPSLRMRSKSQANDHQHAAKTFNKYKALSCQGNQRFAAFHGKSMDNPYISQLALTEITQDMTAIAYRMEIEAEDIDEAPGALWTRAIIENNRVYDYPELHKVVVALDPSATSEGDEAGIIGAGYNQIMQRAYILADKSVQGSPLTWAKHAVELYHLLQADHITAESNNGGEMVETVIHQVDPDVPVKLVHASRGKMTRAEPVSAKYEKGFVKHVGSFPELEDELCLWTPGDASPNRLDSLVWAITDLMLGDPKPLGILNPNADF